MEVESKMMKSDHIMSFPCSHPSFIDNYCTCCNLCLVECGNPAITPFRYIHPNLNVTLDEVKRVRDDNMQHLLQYKKLHLVLDLDHTLIHAREVEDIKSKDKKRVKSLNDAFDVKLSNGDEYVVKLRPGALEFIDKVGSMFELSVYTMGTREYAHQIVEKLGGMTKFSWVEDCVKEYQKGLDVVLSHQELVLIVDDTVDVWEESCKENLIQINRYEFFSRKRRRDKLDKELDRVFNMLRNVHSIVYDGNNNKEDYYIGRKDVRDALNKVLMGYVSFGSHQEQKLCDESTTEKVVGEKCRPIKRLRIKFNGEWRETVCEPIKRCRTDRYDDQFCKIRLTDV